MFNAFSSNFGGFGSGDGTIDFYTRISILADTNKTLLDFGAGRAGWLEDDAVKARRDLRLQVGRFAEVIATDLDPVVLSNQACDRALLMKENHVPLPDHSVDVIIADYVLEHITDPKSFADEVNRLLIPGGWLCARTPHKFNYVVLGEKVLGSAGDAVLKMAQPTRKGDDVFPKSYLLNSMADVERQFPNYLNQSFIRRSDPSYYFGNRILFNLMDALHRIFPAVISGNMFVFLQKPMPRPEL